MLLYYDTAAFQQMPTLLQSETFRFCKITGNKIPTGSIKKEIFCKLLKLHFSELQYNYILNISTSDTSPKIKSAALQEVPTTW